MNGLAVIIVALAAIVALKLFGRVALSVPCLIGGGIALMLFGFVLGPWWVMVAGFVALGAGTYFNELRLMERKSRASEELERRYPANPEFDLFEEWLTQVREQDGEMWG